MNKDIYKELHDKLDKQIKKIEDIADKKADEIEKSYFEKYFNYYDIAIQVLQRHNVLMYGGTAINEILPEHSKFYKPTELPDIDVFCTDYKPISKDIIQTFSKKGFRLTTVKEALHENTYKIMVEGLQLIDLTVIDLESFNKLKRDGLKTSFGIPTVNVNYLKYSMHAMLSRPLDAHRWPKVFQRLIRLYETYPINLDCTFDISKYYIDVPEDIITLKNTWLESRQVIHFGWNIIEKYIKEDTTIQNKFKKEFLLSKKENIVPIEYIILDKHVVKTAKQWVQHTKNTDIRIDHVYPGDNIMPLYVCISYKQQKWLYLFESSSCVSFMEYRGVNTLSIHSLIAYLYEMYLSSEHQDLYCILQLLTAIQINNSLSRKKLFQQFILNCYGYQKGVVTLRKERYLRQLKKKHEMIEE